MTHGRDKVTTLWSWFSLGIQPCQPLQQAPLPAEPSCWLLTWVLKLAHKVVGFIVMLSYRLCSYWVPPVVSVFCPLPGLFPPF